MTLNQEEWEQAKPVDTIRNQLIHFLEKNPDTAFTYEEIAADFTGELNGDVSSIVMSVFFFSVLDDLADQDRIEARRIEVDNIHERSIYYRAKADETSESDKEK